MKTKTANGVEYYFHGDYGSIAMVKPKTIKRYLELKAEEPKADAYGVFFAFGNDQFEEGRKRLISKGYIKDGDKVCSAGSGLYGTESEIGRYLDFYEERSKRIAEECDPQEVYFYEWNNHEVCISMDDDETLKVVASIFGRERAHKIERVYPGTATNVLLPLTERDRHLKDHDFDLMMLGRLSFDCQGFFSEGDCRYHRPADLWAGNIKGQIAEMRKLYQQLPDDIKDASCMTKDEIEDYAKRLEAWADEEFAKAEYDPVPATRRKDYKDLEVPLGYKSLWYRDDDGHWKHPDHVWFSNDTRRWHQDETATAGRAFTSYLGKKGTTLTRVYIDSDNYALTWQPYTRPDLCDVSCKYEHNPLNKRLYDFYHE